MLSNTDRDVYLYIRSRDLKEANPSKSFKKIAKELDVDYNGLINARKRGKVKYLKTKAEDRENLLSFDNIFAGIQKVLPIFSGIAILENPDFIEQGIDWINKIVGEHPILISALGAFTYLLRKFVIPFLLKDENQPLLKILPLLAPVLLPLVLVGGVFIVLLFIAPRVSDFIKSITSKFFDMWGQINDLYETVEDLAEGSTKKLISSASPTSPIRMNVTKTDCDNKNPVVFQAFQHYVVEVWGHTSLHSTEYMLDKWLRFLNGRYNIILENKKYSVTEHLQDYLNEAKEVSHANGVTFSFKVVKEQLRKCA